MILQSAGPRKRSMGYWLVVGAVLGGLYYFSADSGLDLSKPPVKEVSYPVLPSDSLPKPLITAPLDPFEHGWAEISPTAAVAAEAERKLREN